MVGLCSRFPKISVCSCWRGGSLTWLEYFTAGLQTCVWTSGIPIAAFLSTSLRGRVPEVKCGGIGVSGEYLSRPKDVNGDTYKTEGMYKGQQIFNLCAAK